MLFLIDYCNILQTIENLFLLILSIIKQEHVAHDITIDLQHL